MKIYKALTALPASIGDAFAYHDRTGALDRLIPPWKNVRVESTDGSLEVGSRVTLKTHLGPIPLRWLAEHTEYDPPSSFQDIQVSGPFAKWKHQHTFTAAGSDSSVLCDHVEYKVPFGPLGQLFGGGLVQKELETMFAYRHQVTRDDLDLAGRYSSAPMKIAISGASGLVGRQLSALLGLLGHKVYRLERSIEKAASLENAIAPWASDEEAKKLSGFDAVVHLAGKPIADGRWTETTKRQIKESRVDLTHRLAQALASLDEKPSVFVSASAIGIYGDRGDEILTEDSTLADSFLADVGIAWEQAAAPAAEAGIRVVHPRIGIVLDPSGGALQKMLTPAKLLGGALGSGKQWWSWVAIDDVIGSIYHAICTPSLNGPFNCVAPSPMTNRDFANTLGGVLGRPAIFPAPAFMLRLALGEMADALLLASTRVAPTKLEESGYQFRFKDAESSLRFCLGKNRLESIE